MRDQWAVQLNRLRGLAVVAICCGVVATAACTSEKEPSATLPVDIVGGLLEDERTIALELDVCNAQTRVHAIESEDQVLVEITRTDRPTGSTAQSCADVVELTLESELGDRQVVDSYDGETIEIMTDP